MKSVLFPRSATNLRVYEEFMLYDNVNEIANQVFESLLSRYQVDLETILFSIRFNSSIINVTRLI